MITVFLRVMTLSLAIGPTEVFNGVDNSLQISGEEGFQRLTCVYLSQEGNLLVATASFPKGGNGYIPIKRATILVSVKLTRGDFTQLLNMFHAKYTCNELGYYYNGELKMVSGITFN